MTKHKWKDESFSKHNKEECCIKCGVWRTWVGGGAFNCWEYWQPKKNDFDEVKTTFKRPECLGKIT